MNISTKIVFLACVAMVMSAGPTKPYRDIDCTKEGEKVVDESNMCWYWECVRSDDYNDESQMKMVPRACALGSKISYNYVSAMTEPCTINFDGVVGYDCKRTEPSIEGVPVCYKSLQCFNGGSKSFESENCWCNCPLSWSGNYDCSLPTANTVDLPPSSNICVDGEPKEDWCSQGNGCLNGGTCFNQCDTFWCSCREAKDIDYYGKRCEYEQ